MQLPGEGILSTLEWNAVKGSISKNDKYIGNSMTYQKLLIGPKLSPIRILLHSQKLLSIKSHFCKCTTSSKCIRRWLTTVVFHTLPVYVKSAKTLHF